MTSGGITLQILAAGALAGLNLFCLDRAEQSAPAVRDDPTQVREMMYLPDGTSLELLSFGYRNALSNYLWFTTINYFGKHHQGDRNLRWLFHLCDLVTTLDPRALHVYEFGSTMLSWEFNAPADAVRLLDKAIVHHPTNWKLYYLRGFNYMYFLKDKERARDDFVRAAKLPGVHPQVATLAAKKATEEEDPEDAVRFLESLLRATSDAHAREALIGRLKEAIIKRDLHLIERAVGVFERAHGRAPISIDELREAGIITGSLRAPDRGRYELSEDGRPEHIRK